MLEQFHGELLATEGILSTGRALRAKQHQFVHREISLIKQAQELLANGARGAHNRYFHVFFIL